MRLARVFGQTLAKIAAQSATCMLGPEAAAISAEIVGFSSETATILKKELHHAIWLMAASSTLGASAEIIGAVAAYLLRVCGADQETVATAATVTRTATIVLAQSLNRPAETLSIVASAVVSAGASLGASWLAGQAKNKIATSGAVEFAKKTRRKIISFFWAQEEGTKTAAPEARPESVAGLGLS